MYCPACKKEHSDGISFCPDCGKPLRTIKPTDRTFNSQQSSEQNAPGGNINLGDTGLIKDSTLHSETHIDSHNHTETHVDSHDQIGAPAVGGNLHIQNILNIPEQMRIKESLEHCPMCGSVVKEKYFRCKACGRNHLCKEHMDREHLVCRECAASISIAQGKIGKLSNEEHLQQQALQEKKRSEEKLISQGTFFKKMVKSHPIILIMVLSIAAFAGYKLFFSQKETMKGNGVTTVATSSVSTSIEHSVPPSPTTTPILQTEKIGSKTEPPAQTVKNEKAIMEVGIFYEDKNGRLLPLKDGMTLHSKDNYAIYFKPKANSYLYIFQVDAKGKAFKLFPNTEEYKTINNPLKANREYWIPSEGHFFFLDETVGKEEIFFFASNKPIQSLEEISTASKMVMDHTVKLMGVGGITESNVSVQVSAKGATIPFDMAKTKINSEGNLVYNIWFSHK